MSAPPMLTALGLMSGTSLDGIDAAIVKTDGRLQVEFGPTTFMAYDPAFRERLRGVLGQITGTTPDLESLTADLTARHVAAVRQLLAREKLGADDIDVIGFHGQTIAHAPERGLTRQIGNGAALAADLGIDVVNDFRLADMEHGGQGAPLAPLYHAALVRGRGGDLETPTAVLNLGGVGNVTWVGASETVEDALLAFDTGPGNALIDDWVMAGTGRPMDEGGHLARAGCIDEGALTALLDHSYFVAPAPKSLDRDAFSLAPVEGLSVEDGAATLAAFTVESVVRSVSQMPGWPDSWPRTWIVTGGGRKNPVLMAGLQAGLAGEVITAEDAGWDGDALEAQAFAYLAVRARQALPLSVSGTTGVRRPVTGGTLHTPK